MILPYKILVSLTLAEPGNRPTISLGSHVLEYEYQPYADSAYDRIQEEYPVNAVYATAVKLY